MSGLNARNGGTDCFLTRRVWSSRRAQWDLDYLIPFGLQLPKRNREASPLLIIYQESNIVNSCDSRLLREGHWRILMMKRTTYQDCDQLCHASYCAFQIAHYNVHSSTPLFNRFPDPKVRLKPPFSVKFSTSGWSIVIDPTEPFGLLSIFNLPSSNKKVETIWEQTLQPKTLESRRRNASSAPSTRYWRLGGIDFIDMDTKYAIKRKLRRAWRMR